MITMPPEEPHEDRFGRAGAVLVVIESQAFAGHVSCKPHAEAALLAFRIRRELAAPDGFTPVAVEGLALELTALAGRMRVPARPEKWAERGRALLLERFRESIGPGEIAAELGVHPAHLARVFRARYGESLGDAPGGSACSGRRRSWRSTTGRSRSWPSKPGSATRATSRAPSGGSTASRPRVSAPCTADPSRAADTRRGGRAPYRRAVIEQREGT